MKQVFPIFVHLSALTYFIKYIPDMYCYENCKQSVNFIFVQSLPTNFEMPKSYLPFIFLKWL